MTGLHNMGVSIVNRPDPENAGRLDMLAMPMVSAMEQEGMRIDRTHLVKLHDLLTGEMESLAAKVKDMTGESINLGSGDQLADLIYKKLKCKQVGREKWTGSRSRLSVESDVLKQMVAQHEAIKPILDWKEREKLRSTYTYSLIGQLDANDRLHSDLSSTSTNTGRLASSNPNLQNIPIRTKLGGEIRNAFVPRQGYVIGTVDASQIEARMNAVDADCMAMLDMFWRDEDLYWGTAELMQHRVFTPDERKNGIVEGGPAKGLSYKSWYRFNAKTTALMVMYDTSPGGLYDQFLTHGVPGWTEPLCAQAIKDFFTTFPELLHKRKVHHKRAYRYGFAWDMWGRVRWIPQVKSSLQWVVGEGLRAAGNIAGQGGAAGIIKLWMAVIWVRYITYWYRHGVRMLMQIHDELVSEGPPNVLPDFLQECKDLLARLLPIDQFNCPLDSSYGVSYTWGTCEK